MLKEEKEHQSINMKTKRKYTDETGADKGAIHLMMACHSE